MRDLDLNAMKHAALHEIGHTLGLADIKASEMQGYTVMYYALDKNNLVILADYSKFDKYNIEWKYGK
jgi:predicted Zn-dependent protease